MAKRWLGDRKSYEGIPSSLPMGLYAPTRQSSKIVPFEFNWATYGIDIADFQRYRKTIIAQFDQSGVSPFVVPDDYQPAGAFIAVIGAGVDSMNNSNNTNHSGGAGAYAEILAPELLPGSTVYFQRGERAVYGVGQDSWFNITGANTPPTNATEGVLAKGANGFTGGLSAASIGDTVFAGGNGVQSTGTSDYRGGMGGGGAAGPHGAGANGNRGEDVSGDHSGGGGGGADGGSNAIASNSTTGGVGGNNRLGAGGGPGGPILTDGSDGSLGGGGGGAGAMTSQAVRTQGGNASFEPVWTDSDNLQNYGPGSGPGGGGCTNNAGVWPGPAGLPVANGRGSGGARPGETNTDAPTTGAAADGIVVLSYFTSDYINRDLIVELNLEQSVQGALLDQIVSVHIDNSDSNITVYVRFPDSLQTVIAAPGAIVYQPVITSGKKVEVLAEGFTGFINQPITRIAFTNRYVAPQTDYEQQAVRPQLLGSTFFGNPVTNQQKFRYQAVGDLMWSGTIRCDISAPANSDLITFAPPVQLSGYYIYLTDISIRICIAQNAASAALRGFELLFFDTTELLNYMVPFAMSGVAPDRAVDLLSVGNSQIKIPATSILTFSRGILQVAGVDYTLPGATVIATVHINYSIIDERNAE